MRAGSEKTIEETMNIQALPEPAGHEPARVSVDAAKLRDLSGTYVLYRQALVEPGTLSGYWP